MRFSVLVLCLFGLSLNEITDIQLRVLKTSLNNCHFLNSNKELSLDIIEGTTSCFYL